MENYFIRSKDELFERTLENMLGYFNSKYKESKLSYEEGNFKIDGTNDIEMQQMAKEVREIVDFAAKKD